MKARSGAVAGGAPYAAVTSGSAEQTLLALGTFPETGGTGSRSDLILSGANNTQVWYYT